jgi:hypothetical protein
MDHGNGVRHNGVLYGENEVPYVTLGELSPLEAEEAELDENLKRRDLTWQERQRRSGGFTLSVESKQLDAGETHKLLTLTKEIETTDLWW